MTQASMSPDWPGGLACELIAKLLKKYRPDDVTALAEMTTKLTKLKLGKNQNPEELEDDIVQSKMSTAVRLMRRQGRHLW